MLCGGLGVVWGLGVMWGFRCCVGVYVLCEGLGVV